MTPLRQLGSLGQSPWLDYIRKDLMDSGELDLWISRGVTGLTSNPALFEAAIAKSGVYAEDIRRLAAQGRGPLEIYEWLALRDIRRACDALLPVYEKTGGRDGFASLEVPPSMCDDRDQTVGEAHRLWNAVGRPNLMIKVPATAEGLEAVARLTADGLNVNVTLLFTVRDYEAAAQAYIAGLRQRVARGLDPAKPASVASLFVSRLDAALEGLAPPEIQASVSGRAAIANARRVYARFRDIFGVEFQSLAVLGARPQRPLWASTGTKDPALPDTLYVDALAAPDTVNTMPPAVLEAFYAHGSPSAMPPGPDPDDEHVLRVCQNAGIDLEDVGLNLKLKGLAAFAESFDRMLEAIDQARRTAG